MIRDGIDISSDYMTAVYGGEVIATARFGKHAAADGNRAWVVSTHPARLFSYNDAITDPDDRGAPSGRLGRR